jgi:HSP20 family protein
LHGEKGNKKYHTETPVRTELEDSSAKSLYTNGILELTIKLKGPLKSNGKEIKTE